MNIKNKEIKKLQYAYIVPLSYIARRMTKDKIKNAIASKNEYNE
jgi:hypothetical protein